MSLSEYKTIARGRTADVLGWHPGQVLKLFHENLPLASIEREAQIARLVSATDLPTPKLLGEHTLDGRKGLIFERVAGQSMLQRLGTHPWQVVRLARQFAELHARIHQHSGEGLPALKARLTKAIQKTQGSSPGVKSALVVRLAALPDAAMLVHLDYHPDQVMLTESGAVVIDWMNALLGAPAADVAYTLLILNVAAVPDAGWFKRRLTNLLRGIFSRAYLRRYLKCNPLVTRADIDAWLPLAIVARLADGVPGEKERLMEMLPKSFAEIPG